MPRSLFILLFFTVCGNAFGQNVKKDLLPKVWYCDCRLDKDSVVISADNLNNPDCELRFSPTGKLILNRLKKKGRDSSYTYAVKKRELVIQHDMHDSVKTVEYRIAKIPNKRAYRFYAKTTSIYKGKKGDDSIVIDHFTLVMAKKRKTIEYLEDITIFSQKRAMHNDSIDRAVWGQFVGYIKDTLLIDADQYVEHNFYKKYTDSLHYIAPLLVDTVVRIKVPIKDISGIYAQREPFTTTTTNITLLATATGLACVAASIIARDSPAGNALAQVGIYSFLTIPFTFGLGVAFSKQKFLMRSNNSKKKVWKIERHMPRAVVTHKTKKGRGKNR